MPAQIPSQWEDRLCTNEARLEALQESVRRLTSSSHDEFESRTLQQREEIQRLANQIQQVAAMKATEAAHPAVARLEQKIGSWLTNWQGALQTHLNDREQRMTTQLRNEVALLWENTEAQITSLQSRTLDRDIIEERFSRIAAAARALAECASPSRPGLEPATP